ncbi:3-keto-disaccharide hydrolase [Arsenicibacter rosenii]
MKKLLTYAACAMLFMGCAGSKPTNSKGGWVTVFDGKTFTGWKVGANASTFKIEDGAIVVNGPRAHLFYEGPLQNHDFKNFEFKAKVMTLPGSNSGMFIHTVYQEDGWPSKGYEIQVNQTHTDWRKTGSVYGVQDVKEVFVKDNEWYTEHIIVQGKKVTVKINDKVINEYTEPDNVERKGGDAQKKLSSGTVALQGHDPKSKVYYKDIMIKPLP